MDYSYESEHTKFIRELLEKDPQLISHAACQGRMFRYKLFFIQRGLFF